jgi:hypothetical protein
MGNKIRHLLATGLGTPVSCTNKTDRHDITEILLKLALKTINLSQLKETHLWSTNTI